MAMATAAGLVQQLQWYVPPYVEMCVGRALARVNFVCYGLAVPNIFFMVFRSYHHSVVSSLRHRS